MIYIQRPDEPPELNVKFPDLMDDLALYEWAGVSFGRSETYRLYLSIKAFAESLPAEVERLRLFGMIKTRGQPYFVVEGLTAEDPEGLEEMKQEGKSGANKYTYWVTQSCESNSWTQLPHVTMEQIVAARKFKKYMSGNLSAPISSFPPFPGNEANYLRTQIALICGATSVSPAGYFELNEDEDPPTVKLAEAETLNEAFPKAAQELKEPDAWVHHEIELNAIGRCTALPEQLDDNGDPIEPDEPVETTPPLKGIEGEQWAFRVSPGGSGEHAGSLVVAKSLVFPGAIAVAAARRFVNVYVGYGMVYSPVTYSPPLPGALQVEWAPAEEEEPLVETEDVRTDPTPPKAEGEEEDE
jgi:radial spoke head protein 4/6